MNKQFVDTYELTRSEQSIQGQAPLRQFSRFTANLPPQSDGNVEWTITGGRNATEQQFLDLHVVATPIVQCQRCMGNMPYPLNVSSRLQLVKTEAELDVEDDPEASPDEWIEPILASTNLDVLALVEDELILGLPYVPMHENCSTEELEQSQQMPEPEPSPFAVLSQLKKN